MKRIFETRYRQPLKDQKTIIEKIAPYSSLFISVLALSLSIWSARETRIHNELSVQPSIAFYLPFSPLDKIVGIFLDNRGLGPADVDLTVFLDDKNITNWNEITNDSVFLSDFKFDFESGHDNSTIPSWYNLSYGFTIKSGEKISLYYIESKHLKSPYSFRDHLNSHVVVVAHWCSLYGDCGFACSTMGDEECETYAKNHHVQVQHRT